MTRVTSRAFLRKPADAHYCRVKLRPGYYSMDCVTHAHIHYDLPFIRTHHKRNAEHRFFIEHSRQLSHSSQHSGHVDPAVLDCSSLAPDQCICHLYLTKTACAHVMRTSSSQDLPLLALLILPSCPPDTIDMPQKLYYTSMGPYVSALTNST